DCAMKRRITFFLLVTLAAALAHYLVVVTLTQVVTSGLSGNGVSAHFLVPVLWLFTAPMNFLLSSSFGHTLSPIPFQVLFTANSLLWGMLVGTIVLWRRLSMGD